MELHNLKPEAGSVRKSKRVGRGQGSGRGGTSTRGHKGAKSRSGYKAKTKFEGGQTPLQMRVPKRGFKSPNRQAYTIVNLYELQHYAEKFGTKELNIEFFTGKRIARKTDRIKVLGSGELNTTVSVQVHAVSSSAKEAIEKAGGSVELVGK